jgi:aldose 1-epimerase
VTARTHAGPAPSGEQVEIGHGEQRATIVEVGGGVREYVVSGRPVFDPYPLDARCDGAHGAVLVPWPNRLADGTYCFDGEDHQVALTEPATRTAIHGFLRWRPWRVAERDRSRVTMATRLHPRPGYPFMLDVEVAYELTDDGLTVSTTARNVGRRACPYGAGQHPYLSPGSGVIDDCRLRIDAAALMVTDDERKLPVDTRAVAGTADDFRALRPIGPRQLDTPFTDLVRDDRGRAWVALVGTDGHCAELWVDEHHRFLEIYTGDTLAADRRRRGLGVEPMTCPPNAFRTGADLIRLEPDHAVTTTWGARLARTRPDA